MNTKIYEELLFLTKKSFNNNINEIINLIKIIAKFSFMHDIGILYSQRCEDILNKISSDNIRNLDSIDLKFENNSKNILHIFTQASVLGGHTKLAKNWMENSFKDETPHILLLNQDKEELPTFLDETIKIKNGTVISFKQLNNDIEKAENLRAISNNFSYIVLHIDMDDPIGNLAFGHNKNIYPTIFMNHADHIFWLGITAAKVYAELSSAGQEITLLKRNVKNSMILPIALTNKSTKISKSDARKKLGFKEKEKIFLSIASPHKFIPDKNVDFLDMAKRLILSLSESESESDVRLIVIGPDKHKDNSWNDLYKQTKGRIDAIGYVTDELCLYHSACDVYLDSFPFNSYTATLEPALLGKPCVVLDYESKRSIDSLIECDFIAKDVEDYIKKAKSFLNYKKEDESRNIIKNYHIEEGWRNFLKSIYESLELIETTTLLQIENKESIINRFDNFSQNNLKQSNNYFFIKKIKKELKYITFINRWKIIMILSQNYKFSFKLKAFLFLMKGI